MTLSFPDRVRPLLASSGAVQVTGASGSAPAWLVAALGASVPGPILWIAATEEAAEQAYRDLRFWFSDPGSHTSMAEAPARGRRVALYPDWDVSPYAGVSPHAEISRRRIEILHALLEAQPLVVVAPAAALLKRVIPREALGAATDLVIKDEELPRDPFVRKLVEGGYLSTDRTEDRGCFSVRGHILDVYAPLYGAPLRIETWGDTVDAIRRFDPTSQRSVGADLKEAVILPVREEVFTPEATSRAVAALSRLCRERDLAPRHRIALQEQVERGVCFAGIENYLPLFHDRLSPFFEYLGAEALVVTEHPDAIEDVLLRADGRIRAAYDDDVAQEALVPPPETLFLGADVLRAEIARHRRLSFPLALPEADLPTLELRAHDLSALRGEILSSRDGDEGMLAPLVRRLGAWRGDRLKVLLACRSRVQAQQVHELLSAYDVEVEVRAERPSPAELLDPASPLRSATGAPTALPATPARGFVSDVAGLAVVAEHEVFGKRLRARSGARDVKAAFSSFSQLKEGDAIVHARHGIGLFRGLVKLAVARSENDYLLLEYQDGDRLYVPVHQLDRLSRWTGPEGARPSLDKLGGTTWKTRRRKAEEAVQKLARELLDLYAARTVSTRPEYPPPDVMCREFDATFPFEETEDQLEAIAAIRKDLAGDRPMDRLICGDVGFGKTEVAMRAAFHVVASGRQVAVLVPTTILALQHYQSFRERMEGFPVRVAMLSRFVTGGDERDVVRDVRDGKIDVLVATHRLLSEDVRFRDLGLLVIDEEHRFGVKHKERIKALRKDVDVLTMTATPIPRTLNMAMSGLRDLSLITTPPEGRQEVRTYVAKFSVQRVREAIEAEVRRGGQVFFVHNRVRSIHAMARFVERAVPGVRLRVAHGQMAPKELEGIMVEFVQRRFDVLVSTTIIESGIDIPNANTVIVHRADTFGLAQLYQIRGRVGRGRSRGHAWLIVPPGRALRPEALQRLKVLQDHSGLGAGFKIAAHDLELRGAGDLLGKTQHGHIAAVGFEVYMEMLEEAVRAARGDATAGGSFEPEIDIACEAYIPADYVPDQRDRLLYYKRLSTAGSEGEALGVTEELEDLYGRVPEPVERLVELIRLKVLARKLRVARMKRGASGVELHFDPSTPVHPDRLARLLQENSQRLALSPGGTLTIRMTKEERRAPLPLLKKVLQRLG
ncbi:transcription-repair coupling factor [Myxococcota bacterium]|nr:transcription-repair coupling factor [Myxococcota bacterium]